MSFPAKPLDLFILACEPSADRLGASLLQKLSSSSLSISGVMGPQMRALGYSSFLPMEDFMVMGFIDLLPAFPRLMQKFFQLQRFLLRAQPKKTLFIDYPGFNLRLERSLRKKGFSQTMIHFVSPSVWAWGKKRADLLAQSVDHLCTLFPFEPAFYAHTSLPVTYVGHPLASLLQSYSYPVDIFSTYSLEKSWPILTLFPGSRSEEIQKNFPIQWKVAQKIQKEFPPIHLAISYANEARKKEILTKIGTSPVILFPSSQNYEWMKQSHLAIATSGTISLELALHEVPSIITYGMRSFDVFLAKHFFRIRLPFYCIANILLNQELYPELFGPYLTEENLWIQTKHLFCHRTAREKQKKLCQKVKDLLQIKDPAEEVSQILTSFP